MIQSELTKMLETQDYAIELASHQPAIADVVARHGDSLLLFEVRTQRPREYLSYDTLSQVLATVERVKEQNPRATVHPVVVGTFNASEDVVSLAKNAGIHLAAFQKVTPRAAKAAVSALLGELLELE